MTARNDWFNVYAAAILEGDVEKISERVSIARRAIADRIAQLEAGDVAASQEPRDLEDALNKLQILMNVSHTATRGPELYSHHTGAPNYSRAHVNGAA